MVIPIVSCELFIPSWVVRFKMLKNSPRVTSALCCLLLPLTALAADAPDPQMLVTQFWQAGDADERNAIAAQLSENAANVATLYDWMKDGPQYSDDVPTGIVESVYEAPDGTTYPYVFVIPEDYDPETRYPVEFALHGGVGRPKPEPGDELWRGGYDNLVRSDRITVLPSAWREAYWWHDSQADTLPALLDLLKASYNINENRVVLTGVSDGGTGAYFFAFKQPTEWAAFLPYIGHPGVLRSEQSGGGYRLYFEKLMGKPLYIVNGENDRLYPASSLASFMQILEEQEVEHIFRVIEGGGHNTQWMPQERPAIEEFVAEHPRDPMPDSLQWVADRTDRYQRNHWIEIDELAVAGRPALLQVTRNDNVFSVTARGVTEFTLQLNPEEVDLSEPLLVNVNGRIAHTGMVRQDKAVLLERAALDLDREQLFTAALTIQVNSDQVE